MELQNRFKIDGDTTIIFLDRKDGSVVDCFIDTEDLHLISSIKGKWWGSYHPDIDSFYVRTEIRENGKKVKDIRIHRLIMDAPINMEVDHIDRNPLNNKRSNLRIADRTMNTRNRKIFKTNKSGTSGVHQMENGKWRARIGIGKERKHLGVFDIKEDAINAVNRAREKLWA